MTIKDNNFYQKHIDRFLKPYALAYYGLMEKVGVLSVNNCKKVSGQTTQVKDFLNEIQGLSEVVEQRHKPNHNCRNN